MMHQFDHRWATYERDGSVRDVTSAEKADPSFVVLPRYWVHADDVAKSLGDRWDKPWLMGWRDITNSTNERTTIAGFFPRVGVGNNLPVFSTIAPRHANLALAALTSFAVDYAARIKVGGSHLNFFIFEQLPVVAPSIGDGYCPWDRNSSLTAWVRKRVVELVYTAYDMRGLAEDLGDDGEPFRWDTERRAVLRAELDAAFFHLYGLPHDEVDYVMETFPIVRRKDEAAYGEYRTKGLILDAYDAMTRGIATGTPFHSSLDPAPGTGPRHSPRPERILA